MEALEVCRELYGKGVLYPEFSILPEDELHQMWLEGELGVRVNKCEFANDLAQMTDPNKDIGVDGVCPTKYGTYPLGSLGHSGGEYITACGVKDEESLRKVLKFLDNMGNEDMATLFQYEIERKYYTIENGMVVMISDESVQSYFLNNILSPFSNGLRMMLLSSLRARPTERDYLQQRALDVCQKIAEYAVFDDITGLETKTFNERGGDLNTILNDVDVRYIMGVIDQAGYQAGIEKWKDMGGDLVSQEFGEAYREANKIS